MSDCFTALLLTTLFKLKSKLDLEKKTLIADLIQRTVRVPKKTAKLPKSLFKTLLLQNDNQRTRNTLPYHSSNALLGRSYSKPRNLQVLRKGRYR
jgi:hypothetical protein